LYVLKKHTLSEKQTFEFGPNNVRFQGCSKTRLRLRQIGQTLAITGFTQPLAPDHGAGGVENKVRFSQIRAKNFFGYAWQKGEADV